MVTGIVGSPLHDMFPLATPSDSTDKPIFDGTREGSEKSQPKDRPEGP